MIVNEDFYYLIHINLDMGLQVVYLFYLDVDDNSKVETCIYDSIKKVEEDLEDLLNVFKKDMIKEVVDVQKKKINKKNVKIKIDKIRIFN